MNRLRAYLLTVANLYTALWVATQLRPRTPQAWIIYSTLPKEPNPVIMVFEWCLLATAILLNLRELASHVSIGEAKIRTEEEPC